MLSMQQPPGRKMSVDMMGLKKEDFVDGVIDIVTAS